MKTRIFKTIAFIAVAGLVFSCVPASKLEQVKEKKERCEKERDELKAENEKLTTSNNELDEEIASLRKTNRFLEKDTLIKGSSYRTLTIQYDKINKLYSELLANTEKLRAGADAKAQERLALLQETKEKLEKKEDELMEMEKRLNKEKANLEELRANLEVKEHEINQKNKQLADLQSILNSKDSVVNALRKKVSDALLGFEGDGLTVTKKNGKIYVSLEEKLLFQSGKWSVDPQGQTAIKKLGEVLEKNPDINIMIEGHTDNVPYNGGSKIEDNWDLSVKRATAIVKILIDNSEIDPKRLIAAGRGEYFPISTEDTDEARRKNRRTEIILTPKFNELLEILNTN